MPGGELTVFCWMVQDNTKSAAFCSQELNLSYALSAFEKIIVILVMIWV